MTVVTLKIRLILQIVHLALKACAILVNMNDVEKNVQMTDTVLESITNIGFVMCARRCETLTLCRGINFHKTALLCELLSGESSRRQRREGWWYLNTTEWLKNMGISIGMEETACGANDRKIKLSSGDVQCVQQVFPADCEDPRINKRNKTGGVYRISPQRPFDVYCDFASSGGPWTVIQARVDNSVDFDRGWIDFKNGFGDLTGNFWLGNDNMHSLVSARNYTLRIDMEYFDGAKVYAEYSTFNIAAEEDKYRLDIGGYSGDAGDAMVFHNGMYFSAKDQDNDVASLNCADHYTGGWWFKKCHKCYLNGIYYNISPLPEEFTSTGIHWSVYRKDSYSLKTVTMKVRK